MCNHYRTNPDAIPSWREYIGAGPREEWSEIKIDVWPKYQAPVARVDHGQTILDSMAWGVPITMPGKRAGTTVTRRVTNVRNLTNSFWRSMLVKPA